MSTAKFRVHNKLKEIRVNSSAEDRIFRNRSRFREDMMLSLPSSMMTNITSQCQQILDKQKLDNLIAGIVFRLFYILIGAIIIFSLRSRSDFS